MNAYMVAFAIGYYYGRAHPTGEGMPMPLEDIYHRSNQGFDDGLAAGQRDFQNIDLPISAEQSYPPEIY